MYIRISGEVSMNNLDWVEVDYKNLRATSITNIIQQPKIRHRIDLGASVGIKSIALDGLYSNEKYYIRASYFIIENNSGEKVRIGAGLKLFEK